MARTADCSPARHVFLSTRSLADTTAATSMGLQETDRKSVQTKTAAQYGHPPSVQPPGPDFTRRPESRTLDTISPALAVPRSLATGFTQLTEI